VRTAPLRCRRARTEQAALICRYHDDISLEDAIHTALLTLKEGFEGQMTEKTIEIGVVTVPTPAELELEAEVGVNGRPKPSFRKLTEEEVRDYLAL
jgi:20S proteasome subunit alpha 2